MVMAATGSGSKKRHLAQPPRGIRSAAMGRGRLHFPIWVAAVLLVAVLSLLILPMASGEAATVVGAAAESDAVIVPILFPLEERVAFTDTFGAARSGHTHAGNDLMVDKMTPILAVVDGKVDWLNLTGQLSSYNNLPYYNLLLRGDDGNDYFYIHINNDTPGTDDGQGGVECAYAPGLTNGSRVAKGDIIAYVGDSGNAEDVGSHLHFELHLGGYKNPIDPYASLMAAPTLAEWLAGGGPVVTTSTTTTSTTSTTLRSTTTTSTTATTKAPSTTSTTKPASTTSTISNSTSVPGFTDVLTTDWFYPDLAEALAAGIVTESPDGRFRPYSQVSRALFAVYLVRTMASGELESAANLDDEPTFDDVDVDYWAYKEIEIAASLGLVNGTSGGFDFSPESKVTRAQMATMICRALDLDINGDWAGNAAGAYQLYEDVPKDYWAQGAIFMVDYLSLMCGDANDCFRPLDSTTRAQAITVMARLLRRVGGGSES
jgi:murein DD-endopeptidase MepM/ murein hydrolase activator NlpD